MADIRRFASRRLDSFKFGIITGELNLQRLLQLPDPVRKGMVENGPFIDVYLGSTRVYKRIPKVLIYAFCPDIGRFVGVENAQFAIKIPNGVSNVLSVKLAVIYMEEFVMDPRFRLAKWKVRGDVTTYIHLTELFVFIGMKKEARGLKGAIARRMASLPLRLEQVRGIWGRENKEKPSAYSTLMARNLFTFSGILQIERYMKIFDQVEDEPISFAEKLENKWRESTKGYPGDKKIALAKARHDANAFERYLEEARNLVLKQLLWTSNSLPKIDSDDPATYRLIENVKAKTPCLPGVKKIVLKEKSAESAWEDYAF
ncbi:hypothetical protein BDV96DRAFT_487978 [Lophiotrema nucula]|uniref:Uncharacterized protein n=1 Tax=Lophiotrema nucula TaxID=690887 RepID=A0A6A5ZKJ4_9PLEO|nr:hypothetical protein BDV96DRAFT_487978 [Lophiotrema nucula]